MLEVRNLESVKIEFPCNLDVSKRLFGPSKPAFISNWSEERIKSFSYLISELDGSEKEEDIFLSQQCHVAIEIIHFATIHGGEIYMVLHSNNNNTLEFFFEFHNSSQARFFATYVKEHVKKVTGFRL